MAFAKGFEERCGLPLAFLRWLGAPASTVKPRRELAAAGIRLVTHFAAHQIGELVPAIYENQTYIYAEFAS